MDDLIEQMAKAFHAAVQEHPGCVAFDWDELSDERRAWKIRSMRAALAVIAAHPRYELLELPEPTHGPDGEGQLSWHTGTSVISATPGGRVWEEDFDMEPHEAQENAAVLLAAAKTAEEPK